MKIKRFEYFEMINEEVKPSKVARKVEIDGYEILVGKSAKMNDVLTFELATPEDIWMHASGVPGSHVVIKVKDDEVPRDIIKYAAKLAAENSKSTGKTKVVYTKRKYVTKKSDHNDGQVSVNYSMSNFVNVYV